MPDITKIKGVDGTVYNIKADNADTLDGYHYDSFSLSGHGHPGGLSFNDNCGIVATMGGGTDYWSICGTGTNDDGRLKITVGDNATSDWIDFQFIEWSGATYTPMQMTGNQVIINNLVRGGTSDKGLAIQSISADRSTGWAEGVYIVNHSSNYSVLALGSDDKNDVLALVQNSATNLHYFDVKVDGVNRSITIPHKTGTMALDATGTYTILLSFTSASWVNKEIAIATLLSYRYIAFYVGADDHNGTLTEYNNGPFVYPTDALRCMINMGNAYGGGEILHCNVSDVGFIRVDAYTSDIVRISAYALEDNCYVVGFN